MTFSFVLFVSSLGALGDYFLVLITEFTKAGHKGHKG